LGLEKFTSSETLDDIFAIWRDAEFLACAVKRIGQLIGATNPFPKEWGKRKRIAMLN